MKKMRLLLVVLLFVLAFGIISCGKKEEKKDEMDGGSVDIEQVVENNELDISKLKPTSEAEFLVRDGVLVKFYNFSGDIKNVIIPSSVNGQEITKIPADVFIGEEFLEGIVIPDTVTEIEDGAFCNCVNLSQVVLSSGLKTIPKSTFYNTAIENVEIPEGVESIGKFAFGECKSLQQVTLPDSLKTIEAFAFIESINLQDVVVPDSVTAIGRGAFLNASSEEVTLPSAFENDSTLFVESEEAEEEAEEIEE